MSQRNAGNPSKYAPKTKTAGGAAAGTAAASSSAAGPAGAGTGASAASPFPLALVAKLAAWSFVWWLCCRVEFGSIFLVLSAIVAMFRNLSSETGTDAEKPKGRLSAYSVFNDGATRIAGSMDADSIDDQIRQKATKSKGINLDIGSTEQKEHPTRPSKAANQPCVCGSGKKYKNCCSPLTASDKRIEAEWAEWEEEWAVKK